MVALTKPSAIIWDWDNTLVDTWPVIYAALVETFKAFEIEPWSIDRVKSNVKKSMRDSFPEVFGEGWQRAADIYQQSYRAIALERIVPLAGSEATLKHFKALDIPMVVVSNKKGDNLRAEMQHIGWGHYFLSVVGAGDAKRDKPDASHAWHALAPHGIEDTSNIWFIGDSDADLECAKNIGCKAVLYGEHASTMEGYSVAALNGFAFEAHAKNHEELQRLAQF